MSVFTRARAGERTYKRGKCLENLCGVRSSSRSLSGPNVCEIGPVLCWPTQFRGINYPVGLL